MQPSPETEAILRRMEEVRRELDEGAQEIADSAHDMLEWRYYVKNYSWICVGAACEFRYLFIPRHRLRVWNVNRTIAEVADHHFSATRSGAATFAGRMDAYPALDHAGNRSQQII